MEAIAPRTGRIVEINQLALFPRVLAQSLTDFSMRKSVSEFAMRATLFPAPIEAIANALVAILS